MRILVLDCDYFGESWRTAGHEVLTCGDGPASTLCLEGYFVTIERILAALGSARAPDVIFWGDRSQGTRVLGLENCTIPKVMYSVDTHHHLGWHVPYSRVFDAVFIAQRDYLADFHREQVDAQWLPPFALAAEAAPGPADKLYDMCFVGTLHPTYHHERRRFIERIGERVPLHVAEGPYVETFHRSRIVLNQTVRGDLNFRVFEALACGSFLLTERTGNGLLDLFADGVHLVTYERGNVDDAVARARRYLADPEARQRITTAGWQEVRRRHLRSHRADLLLRCFEGLIARGRARPSLDPYMLALNQSLLYFRLHERVARIHAYWRTATTGLPGDRGAILARTADIAEAYLRLARRYVSLARDLSRGDSVWRDLAGIISAQGPAPDQTPDPGPPCHSGT